MNSTSSDTVCTNSVIKHLLSGAAWACRLDFYLLFTGKPLTLAFLQQASHEAQNAYLSMGTECFVFVAAGVFYRNASFAVVPPSC